MAKVLLSPGLWFLIIVILAFIELVRFAFENAEAEGACEDGFELLYRLLCASRDQFRLNWRMIPRMILVAGISWVIVFSVLKFGSCYLEHGELHWPWQGATFGAMLFDWVLAPFLEEIFCRGVIFSFLRRRCKAPLAIFLSAAIFTLVHPERSFVSLSLRFIGGIEFALIYLWTKSLMPGIIAHAGYNILIYTIWW